VYAPLAIFCNILQLLQFSSPSAFWLAFDRQYLPLLDAHPDFFIF
jgi:hypothetical protein